MVVMNELFSRFPHSFQIYDSVSITKIDHKMFLTRDFAVNNLIKDMAVMNELFSRFPHSFQIYDSVGITKMSHNYFPPHSFTLSITRRHLVSDV